MPPKTATNTTTRSQVPKRSSPVKNAYLLAYNAVSAVLWGMVLWKTIRDGILDGNHGAWFAEHEDRYFGFLMGSHKVFYRNQYFVRWVQTLAGMEVLHSLFGIVRAPLMTTLMQVASRFLLVWLIAYPFPSPTMASPAYTTMLLAWSITEVIRYSYFVFVLAGTGVPRLWTWLRYNMFLVLYPMGVSSECWLVWKATERAGWIDERLTYALYAILAIYVPGIYILYTHMLKQRRRVLSGKGKAE